MATFLANENVPGEVVQAARQAGHDVAWITELSAGADDDKIASGLIARRLKTKKSTSKEAQEMSLGTISDD
jgi:hypothetical protein